MNKSVIYGPDSNIIDQDLSPSLCAHLRKLHHRGETLPRGWHYNYTIADEEKVKACCDRFGFPYPANVEKSSAGTVKEIKKMDLEETFDELSKRFVKAVREERGMRLTVEEVHALTCVNWNTVENPFFDEE